MATFLYALNAIAPIIPLIVLGFFLRRWGYFDDYVIRKINAFAFRFTMSSLMFCNMYSLDTLSAIHPEYIALVLVSILCITATGFVLAQLATKRRGRRGVIIQASFRSNFAVIGLILAGNLCGDAGRVIATGIQAPGIIYYNIAAVLCLTAYAERPGKAVKKRDVLRSIATNPMILGLFFGMCCLLIRGMIPQGSDGSPVFSLERDLSFLYSCVKHLADMTTPLVLITLGAQLNFSAVGGMKRELAACVIMRLLGAPAIGLLTAFAMQYAGWIRLTPPVISAMLSFWGAPMAVAGALMAEEMGCDGELARQCAVWTSALSLFTLFLWVLLLRTVGLL